MLPTKREQFPRRSDTISSSAKISAHDLTSSEPTLTKPKTRRTSKISSGLYDIVINRRDGDSDVRNSKMDKSDHASRDGQTSKSFKTKVVPIDKSDGEDTKAEDIKKPIFPNKEKFTDKKDFGKKGDLSEKLSQPGQTVEMKYKENLISRRKQMGANLERLRSEVEATMSKVVRTMLVEKRGRKEEKRRNWAKGKGRRGRLRLFKVRAPQLSLLSPRLPPSSPADLPPSIYPSFTHFLLLFSFYSNLCTGGKEGED